MTALTSTASGVVLTTGSYSSPITIATGVTIANEGIAIYGPSDPWTIQNSGYVHGYLVGEGNDGYGIVLAAGGDITNTATGTIAAQGDAGMGVRIGGGAGILLNQGRITSDHQGVHFDAGGSVSNAAGGYIGGGGIGLYIAGADGTVVNSGMIKTTGTAFAASLETSYSLFTNQAGGVVSGYDGVYFGGITGGLTNDGAISAAHQGILVNMSDTVIDNEGIVSAHGATYSVGIYAGGSLSDVLVTNGAYGAIIASDVGVGMASDDSTIDNEGLILASSGPAILGWSGSGDLQITNAASGLIEGGAFGVVLNGASSTIENAGLITALNDEPGIGILVDSEAADVCIDNQLGAEISGQTAIAIDGADGTVMNGGSIIGGLFDDNEASFGIYASTGADDLTVTNSGSGIISGGTGIVLGGSDSTVVNNGTIATTGGTYGYAGILVQSGADSAIITNNGEISANYFGIAINAASGTVTNSGVIAASNTEQGAGIAVWSNADDTSIMNTGEGGETISGYTGIYVGATDVTITNDGSVLGSGQSYYSAGVYVTSLAAGAYITNGADATIAGYYGVYLGGSGGTVINDGVIQSTGESFAAGIAIADGAESATITNATSGTISGYYGMSINADDAVVTNQGTITGTGPAPAAGIATWSGTADTTITNDATGTIWGSLGVYLRGDGDTVINAGLITTTGESQYSGIYVAPSASDAFISNAAGGEISGAYFGIAGDGDHIGIVNAGWITGISTGPDALDTQILNRLTGTITAATGVFVGGADSTITNQGQIDGLACYSNAGIYAGPQASGLVIVNQSYGTISGYHGIYLTAADARIANLGLIEGAGFELNDGIHGNSAATGVLLNNETGGVIAGVVDGIYLAGAGASIVNAGGIYSPDTAVVLNGDNATIENDLLGTIGGASGIAFGGVGGYLDNASAIIGYDGFGVGAQLDVTIVNEAVGSISGSSFGVVLYGSGMLTNEGSIFGQSAVGIYGAGDTVSNAGSIGGNYAGIYVGDTAAYFAIDNQPGGVIVGETGIFVAGYYGSILNQGAIVGLGGIAGPGEASIDNQGLILGYDVGIFMQSAAITNEAGYYIVGAGGDGVVLLGGGSVDNYGTILGIDGTGVTSPGDISVTNEVGAHIYGLDLGVYIGGGGTLTNAGLIDSDSGSAVSFGSVSGHLIVEASGGFGGVVDGGSGLSSIELASGGGDGTLSGLGTGFINFDQVTVDAGAVWFLQGANTLGDGATVDNEGVLIVDVGASLTGEAAVINDGLLIIDPGVVLAASVIGTGSVTIEAGATLSIGDTVSAGETLAFDTHGYPALLQFETSADMQGTIAGFGVGDVIDLGDFAFTPTMSVSVSGNVMTVTDGSTTETFATSGLADGTHILALSDGNGGTDLLYAALPAIGDLSLAPASDTAAPNDNITSDTMPEIDGTGIAGDTITLYDGATAVGTATVGIDGTWAITTGPLADGVHDLTAVESDTSNNLSPATSILALTIDTTAPDAPDGLALSPATDSGLSGDENTDIVTPAIMGTGEVGDLVTVYEGETIVGTATVGLDGSWSVTTDTLAVGVHSLTATQTDLAGNVSDSSSSFTLTIDHVNAPTGLTLSPQSDTGTLLDRVTADSTPTITGTAASGESIKLFDGDSLIGTATADQYGHWSITSTLLSDGHHTLTATATDLAENVSSASASLALVIDTTAPDAPTLDQTATLTNTAEPMLTGAAEAGSVVRIYQDNSLVGTTTASDQGWSFAYSQALAPGDYTLTATATDAAGNLSDVSAGLMVHVNNDSSYDVMMPVPDTSNTQHFVYDSSGALVHVDTTNSTQQLLTSVTGSLALINIYDASGNLIGTIQQPSLSLTSQPVFSTTPDGLSAQSSGSQGSNLVDLLSETNYFVSQGNDDIIVHSGTAVITAWGPTTLVNNLAANLVFNGETGSSTVYGGSGSDTIVGGSAGGTLVGGTAGNNLLAAGGGNTLLVGGGNGDVLFGSADGTDTMYAGAGQEILIAGGGTSTINLNQGDLAFGGTGQSSIFGSTSGGDIMIGGTGDVAMMANGGDNLMCAGLGNSTIWAGSGQDTLLGGNNAQSMAFLHGGMGNDVFLAGPGAVTAIGGTGNDIFWAGSGTMNITEGQGNDTVVAGAGDTTVTGGAGPDIYVLNNGGAGGNLVINDFKVGVDQVAYFGYNTAPSEAVIGGNTVLTFTDNTTITLVNVTHLAPGSLV